MTNNKIVTFHILLALQFVLVAAGMLVNIKVGLFSMIIILLFTTICLIQLNNDEQTNWKAGQNIMTYMFTIWLCFYLLEILNPNNVLAAWNINLTPYALIPLICAFVVPLVVRTKKDIELLLIIWSVFVLVFTIKGYWQKNYGFSSKDLYFLHVLGGWRTHIIWSGIRYFSCFSDAANYGVHAAMSAVVSFLITSTGRLLSSKIGLRLLCGVQMATHLLPLHRRRGTLRNGYFGNPCSYGSHHGRNVNDNRHCQKLESVIGRYIHIHQRFRVLQLYQYRKREPIYPQDALLFPSVRRRFLPGACRKPAKDERIDGKETVRLRHWTLQSR